MPLALRALLLILVALIPAGFVQVWLEREAREVREAQVAEQALRLVRLVAAQQARILEGAEHLLGAMAAAPVVRAARPDPECDRYMSRLRAAFPRYTSANLYGLDGRAICSPVEFGENNTDVSDRFYFREALRTRRFTVGTYAIGRATGEATLHLSTPLLGDDGQARGVLLLGLSIRWLSDELGRLVLPEGSSSTIADREGTILARSREPERFVGTRLPPASLALLESRDVGLIPGPALDGVRRIAAYVPLREPPEGLFITLGLDAQSSLAAAERRDRRVSLMIVGSLVAAFLLALMAFGAAIERPVRALLTAAQRWGRQDWGARVGAVGGGREFKRLGAAFDAMAEEVERREAARAASEARLSALLDLSPQIVLTAAPDGTINWLNRHWHAYTGSRPSGDVMAAWRRMLHPDDREGARDAWAEAVRRAAAGEAVDFIREVRIFHAASGVHRWHVVRAQPMRRDRDEAPAWVGVGVDTHELRLARAAAEEAAGRFRATYENAPVGLALLDRGLRFVAANGLLADLAGASPDALRGRPLGEAPAPLPALLGQTCEVASTGTAREEVEVSVGAGEAERVFLCGFRPLRGEAGEVTGVTAAVLDITARKQAERAERLLSREVDHRAKNALAVVRSLARLSLAESRGDAEAVVEALEGRISAMARVHTVLARERWVGAALGELVQGELEAFDADAVAEGPALRLSAEAAQPLTMILHELATNAAKYGALSLPGGTVRVRWRAEADGGVALEWEERGGPRLSGAPPEPGFGSRLIEANATGPLGGEARMEWRPDGLLCRLRIAAEAVRD